MEGKFPGPKTLAALERGIPLFQNVRLLDTRREPFLRNTAVAFRVDFALDPEGEVSQ